MTQSDSELSTPNKPSLNARFKHLSSQETNLPVSLERSGNNGRLGLDESGRDKKRIESVDRTLNAVFGHSQLANAEMSPVSKQSKHWTGQVSRLLDQTPKSMIEIES